MLQKMKCRPKWWGNCETHGDEQDGIERQRGHLIGCHESWHPEILKHFRAVVWRPSPPLATTTNSNISSSPMIVCVNKVASFLCMCITIIGLLHSNRQKKLPRQNGKMMCEQNYSPMFIEGNYLQGIEIIKLKAKVRTSGRPPSQ